MLSYYINHSTSQNRAPEKLISEEEEEERIEDIENMSHCEMKEELLSGKKRMKEFLKNWQYYRKLGRIKGTTI